MKQHPIVGKENNYSGDREMIDVTGVDLVKFAQETYRLSQPQGLGFLHFQPGGLSDEQAKALVAAGRGDIALSMDYVNGRACKMTVRRSGDKLQISDSWYDHTDAQLHALLAAFNINPTAAVPHGGACECSDCKRK